MTTTIDFLQDGSWIRDGSFARFLGALFYFRLVSLLFRRLSSLQRMAMSSFPASVMADDGSGGRVTCIQGVLHLIYISLVTYGAPFLEIFCG
jgi:hypothetical protein